MRRGTDASVAAGAVQAAALERGDGRARGLASLLLATLAPSLAFSLAPSRQASPRQTLGHEARAQRAAAVDLVQVHCDGQSAAAALLHLGGPLGNEDVGDDDEGGVRGDEIVPLPVVAIIIIISSSSSSSISIDDVKARDAFPAPPRLEPALGPEHECDALQRLPEPHLLGQDAAAHGRRDAEPQLAEGGGVEEGRGGSRVGAVAGCECFVFDAYCNLSPFLPCSLPFFLPPSLSPSLPPFLPPPSSP